MCPLDAMRDCKEAKNDTYYLRGCICYDRFHSSLVVDVESCGDVDRGL